MTLTLIDLDETDGVTPWITFAGNGPSSAAGNLPGGSVFEQNVATGPFMAVQANVAHAPSRVDARVIGSGEVAGSSLYSSGYVTLVPQREESSFFGVVYGADSAQFTLSANTLLLVGGQSTVTAAVTAEWVPTQGFHVPEQARAQNLIRLEGAAPAGPAGQQRSEASHAVMVESKVVFGLPTYPGYSLVSASTTETSFLSAAFVNADNADAAGKITVASQIYGMTPVPEPAMVLLTLGGLMGVALAVRCSRKGYSVAAAECLQPA